MDYYQLLRRIQFIVCCNPNGKRRLLLLEKKSKLSLGWCGLPCLHLPMQDVMLQTGLQLPQCKKTAQQWQLKQEVWQIALACDVHWDKMFCYVYCHCKNSSRLALFCRDRFPRGLFLISLPYSQRRGFIPMIPSWLHLCSSPLVVFLRLCRSRTSGNKRHSK